MPDTAPAPRREIFAWAMYDFANSGYTTVVLTAIYSAYFVGVVARADGADSGTATFLWTLAMGVANFLVLASAPVIGAIADHRAWKKRFLLITTVGCVGFTTALGFVSPGNIGVAMALVILASAMFASGENLIAAFLPEIARPNDMGRISGYGWTLGYLGGVGVLYACFRYIEKWAIPHGQEAAQFVPVTLWFTAGVFAIAALPTFLWLRERAIWSPLPANMNYFRVGITRIRHTLSEARHFRDLFRFLITLTVYYCGINIVVVLAAVYAQEVMGFKPLDILRLILVVNITAAVGAFGFGLAQDRFGSVRTLALTLILWIVALVLAYFIETRDGFWVVANLVGLALGSSQSAGRALVGQFSPPERSAEFFGLWGLAGKLAAVIGPLTYGLIAWASHGNHRLALLSTTVFFITGLALLLTVNETRGRAAVRAGA